MLQQILSNAFSLGMSIVVLVLARFILILVWDLFYAIAEKFTRMGHVHKWATRLMKVCWWVQKAVTMLFTLKEED